MFSAGTDANISRRARVVQPPSYSFASSSHDQQHPSDDARRQGRMHVDEGAHAHSAAWSPDSPLAQQQLAGIHNGYFLHPPHSAHYASSTSPPSSDAYFPPHGPFSVPGYLTTSSSMPNPTSEALGNIHSAPSMWSTFPTLENAPAHMNPTSSTTIASPLGSYSWDAYNPSLHTSNYSTLHGAFHAPTEPRTAAPASETSDLVAFNMDPAPLNPSSSWPSPPHRVSPKIPQQQLSNERLQSQSALPRTHPTARIHPESSGQSSSMIEDPPISLDAHHSARRSSRLTASEPPIAGPSRHPRSSLPPAPSTYHDEESEADAEGETEEEEEPESPVEEGSKKRKRGSGPKRPKKVKLHSCPTCGKKFPRPSGLAIHSHTHTGEKPFVCDVQGCSKHFAVRSNMNRHMKTHGAAGIAALARRTDRSAHTTELSSDETGPRQFGFEDPVIAPTPSSWRTPARLKWIPDSLSMSNNIVGLRARADVADAKVESVSPVSSHGHLSSLRPASSASSGGSSTYTSEIIVSPHEQHAANVVMQSMPTVPVPLPPVVPSPLVPLSTLASSSSSPSPLSELNHLDLEERNSFARTAQYPYHPSHFRVLPGPAPSAAAA